MIRTPIVERSVDLGDVWLNVASAGSGRPVVLLQGSRIPGGCGVTRSGRSPPPGIG